MSSANDTFFSTPGNRVAHARDIKKISQADLGELVGKTKLTIGRWERGESPIPSLAWDALSRALGVREEWLRSGEQPMEPAENHLTHSGEPARTISGEPTLTTAFFASPHFSDPWHFLGEVIQSRGLKLSPEEQLKIACLAAAKAIMEKRDPIRKDVIDSLGIILNQE
jgi:transcriptional regulator with XRE-family HTH domain